MTNPKTAERALRRRLRTDLAAWAEFVLAPQGHTPARHHKAILERLQGLSAGDSRRLMLLLPPGYAKSTYASRIFPAWWMARHPGTSVVMACHTLRLAEEFGRGVRGLLTEHGRRLNVRLRDDARAARHFMTEAGGDFFAVGVGGAVTGRRADLAVIDDPIASMIQAESAHARERLWEWYRTELLTRLKPGGRVVLAMTRWHRDDLAGRLTTDQSWARLTLPGIAGTGDALGRDVGEVLWPEWENEDAVIAKRTAMGDRNFAALYQQAPLSAAGKMFKTSAFRVVDIVPVGVAARGWDLASGTRDGGNPDWTVGVKLIRDAKGAIFIDDIERIRVGPGSLQELVANTAARDGTAVVIGLPRDPGQAGAFQMSVLTRMLAGYRVRVSPETGSKVVRADPVASQINAGNVYLRRAPWNQALIDELAAFPGGDKDDQVDALSRAFMVLCEDGGPARFTNLPILGR